MNNINKPYTYAIGWSEHKKWYYGVRISKKAYVGDIWKNYFTSSPLVKEFVKNYGQPDTIKVTRVFDSIDEAILHEYKFLKRVRVNTNLSFINAHCAPCFQSFNKNPMKNEKTKQKMIRTKTRQNLLKSIRNKTFKPHPSKIKILKKYLFIIDNLRKTYPKIKALIEYRINLCNLWKTKNYPKNRKRPKRGPNLKISRSKIGKKSYFDPITKICKMFGPNDLIPLGWKKGLIKNTPNNNTFEVRKKLSESQKKSRSLESEEKKIQRVNNWKKSRSLKLEKD